jgi:hypothetical protein
MASIEPLLRTKFGPWRSRPERYGCNSHPAVLVGPSQAENKLTNVYGADVFRIDVGLAETLP